MPTVLIVDDEANIRSSLQGALTREGYDVETAADPAEAHTKLVDSFDVVLLDVWFPTGNGLDLLAEIRSGSPDSAVIMMSGHATVEAAVQATRLGAFDFLEKPIGLERLLVLLRNATKAVALESENRRLREPWMLPIVGRSPAVRKLLDEVARAGPSHARVLIEGEHGTGKELVARALHASSPRRDHPFVAMNCSAIPEELIESELFGHERGAFTGATQARRGQFEEANGGTLFLDEVGDLSPRAQTKLLRVLQEGELMRVGGNRTIRVDVRVIAATNRNLRAAIHTGGFREDLYFRLAVVPLAVPPLRERREDVPVLVAHFSAAIARQMTGRPRRFSAEAIAALQAYGFPGNIRELRNLVERLTIMVSEPVIDAEHVRDMLHADLVTEERRLKEAMRIFERRQIEKAIAEAGGNVTQAAQQLGLERSHLYKKMRNLGIKSDER